jgi:hypothetical protein
MIDLTNYVSLCVENIETDKALKKEFAGFDIGSGKRIKWFSYNYASRIFSYLCINFLFPNFIL